MGTPGTLEGGEDDEFATSRIHRWGRVTVLVVGAVLTVLFVLRGFRNRTRSGLYPSVEESSDDRPSRQMMDVEVNDPAPYRVVHWQGTPTHVPPAPPRPLDAPVTVRTEGDVTVVTTGEQPREIVLEDKEKSST